MQLSFYENFVILMKEDRTMVGLRICDHCARGDHEKCEGGEHPPRVAGEVILGGFICTCRDDFHRDREKRLGGDRVNPDVFLP